MPQNSPTDPASVSPTPAEPESNKQHSGPVQIYRSKVYRAKEADGWIVEPPRDKLCAEDKMVFTGPQAQQLALTYAYERFGNARFFPY